LSGGAGSTSLQGTSTEGQYIIFLIRHIIGTAVVDGVSAANTVRVYYGPNGWSTSDILAAAALGEDGAAECTDVALSTPTNVGEGQVQLQCRTGAGVGGPYVFVVKALNAASAPGSDQYSYPAPPEVHRVQGCDDVANSTQQCPTIGGVLVTVHGARFADGSPCLRVCVCVFFCFCFFFFFVFLGAVSL
jgi:hypothetical protein